MGVSVTRICQCCALSAIIAGYFWEPQLDACLQHLWLLLRQTPVVQCESFEPLVVAASFASWHLLFFLLDSCFFQALKQWRIQESDDLRHWKVEGAGR